MFFRRLSDLGPTALAIQTRARRLSLVFHHSHHPQVRFLVWDALRREKSPAEAQVTCIAQVIAQAGNVQPP